MSIGLCRILGIALILSLPGWSFPAAMLEDVTLEPPEDWREAAREHGLTAEDIARLERDGILVTNETYKHFFRVPIGLLAPFITSDSLLNAYHVLSEESIRHIEIQHGSRMPSG